MIRDKKGPRTDRHGGIRHLHFRRILSSVHIETAATWRALLFLVTETWSIKL